MKTILLLAACASLSACNLPADQRAALINFGIRSLTEGFGIVNPPPPPRAVPMTSAKDTVDVHP